MTSAPATASAAVAGSQRSARRREMAMRLVQYTARGTQGSGVQVGDDVFPTGYPTTLALIEDGDRGLESAQRATVGEPVSVDRIIFPIRPGKIFGSGGKIG